MSWSGKSKGTLLGYKIFIGVLRIFGLKGSYLLLHIVIFYYWIFSRKSYNILYDFYTGKFNYSPKKTRRAIYRNFYLMGQTIIDKIAFASGIYTDFSYNNVGEYNIHNWISEGRGAVLIGSHVGAWDMAAQLLKDVKTTINVVVFDDEHQELRNYFNELRQADNVKFITLSDDFSHILAIKNALSNNEVVCFNGDRYTNKNSIIPSSFLGETAWFPKGVFLLAAKFQTPIAYTAGLKTGFNTYQFYCIPLKQLTLSRNRKERDTQLQLLVKEYVEQLEKTVRKYPTHWFNHYDFWEEINQINGKKLRK